jgi:NADH:ubiquinone reductase (H+-translocating)
VNTSDTFTERVRLHQWIAGQPLKAQSITRLLSGSGIAFIKGTVMQLKPAAHEVVIAVADGAKTLRYDILINALGSHIDLNAVPGVRDFAYSLNTNGLRSIVDLRALLPALNQRGGRLVIVGGGLTGIESATELAETFPRLQVHLVDSGRLGETLSRKGQAHLRQVLERMEIQVYENAQVAEAEQHQLRLTSGDIVPFDTCLWAGGFRANPLAEQSGLAVNERGQMLIDLSMRSISHPDIYGVGDAALPVEIPGAPIRMACATALPMGAHTADNIAAILSGNSPRPFHFGYLAQCISLGRHDGLIQFVDSQDRPREFVFTGRFAAWFKEMICRYAYRVIPMEKRLPGLYRWPRHRTESTSMEQPQKEAHGLA